LMGPSMLEHLTKLGLYNTLVVVNDPLQGINYRNVFSLNADSNAVITVDDHDRYFPNMKSYLLYFIIRQTISILNPELRTHLETPECYLHAKINKNDIKISAKVGKLCSSCHEKLSTKCNPKTLVAIEKMMQLVTKMMPET